MCMFVTVTTSPAIPSLWQYFEGGYDSVKWKEEEALCNTKVEVTTARHVSKVAQICHACKQCSLYQGHISVSCNVLSAHQSCLKPVKVDVFFVKPVRWSLEAEDMEVWPHNLTKTLFSESPAETYFSTKKWPCLYTMKDYLWVNRF